MQNPVFRVVNMVASVIVFLLLPAELDLLPIGWLLISSLAGVLQVNRAVKA